MQKRMRYELLQSFAKHFSGIKVVVVTSQKKNEKELVFDLT